MYKIWYVYYEIVTCYRKVLKVSYKWDSPRDNKQALVKMVCHIGCFFFGITEKEVWRDEYCTPPGNDTKENLKKKNIY